MKARLIIAAGVALLLCQAASADGHGKSRTPLLPLYQQECGSCHVAFPPELLPAASWQRLLADLPHHFGSDASLDEAGTKTLGAWLAANAGSGRRAEAPPQDRITRSAWFLREHDEVSAATWKRPAVQRASNCAACHTQADQGDFRERNIRIPR